MASTPKQISHIYQAACWIEAGCNALLRFYVCHLVHGGLGLHFLFVLVVDSSLIAAITLPYKPPPLASVMVRIHLWKADLSLQTTYSTKDYNSQRGMAHRMYKFLETHNVMSSRLTSLLLFLETTSPLPSRHFQRSPRIYIIAFSNESETILFRIIPSLSILIHWLCSLSASDS